VRPDPIGMASPIKVKIVARASCSRIWLVADPEESRAGPISGLLKPEMPAPQLFIWLFVSSDDLAVHDLNVSHVWRELHLFAIFG
jgi:hypothetical protein